MRRSVRRLAIFTFLALTALAPMAQTGTSSKSVSIRIVAVVPQMLKLSLDFSASGSAQVLGFVPGDAMAAPGLPAFEIKEGSQVTLGAARLFSNVPGSYSITIVSQNGGMLRETSGASTEGVPYNVLLDGREASSANGEYRFATSGKSKTAGTPLQVALAIGQTSDTLRSGYYSDQLYFSIAAN